MRSRILAILLCAAMLVTVLAGCIVLPDGNGGNGDEGGSSFLPESDGESAFLPDSSGKDPEQGGQGSPFVVKLSGNENTGYYFLERLIGYKASNGKYGAVTLDGSKDTGAVYYQCDGSNGRLLVTKERPNDASDIAALNSTGMLDESLKEVIPAEYALIKGLSQRFFIAYKVTEQTESRDEALIYFTSDLFSISASEDDVLYKGNWCVYDVESGTKVPGVEGSESVGIYVRGGVLSYTNEQGESILVDARGKSLPAGSRVFENGNYLLEAEGTVYDSAHNKLFSYDTTTGFNPVDAKGSYYIAASYSGGARYVIWDQMGKPVSPELTVRPSVVCGKAMIADSTLYDLQGNRLAEGSFYSIKERDGYLMARGSNGNLALLDSNNTVVYSGQDESISAEDYYFLFAKVEGGVYSYFSLKDKTFSVEGYSVGPWLVQRSCEDGTKELVNTKTGDVILSGYPRYSAVEAADGTVYLFATRTLGGFDVYRLK